jgi:hypothetical protein
MTELFPVILILLIASGAALVGGLLALRTSDQRVRDAERDVVTLRLPRGLTETQRLAVVRVFMGLAPATTGVTGRDSVAVEVVGTAAGIEHRLRLPRSSSAYLIAQLRAAMPGIAVEAVAEFTPERCRTAVELKRRITETPLVVDDAGALSRTVLAAMTGLHRQEQMVWQLVVGGGVFERPEEERPPLQMLLLGRKRVTKRARRAEDNGVVGVVIRLGAMAESDRRAGELVARLRRAASSASAPGARLVPRLIPRTMVADRLARAATPVTATPVPVTPKELAELLGLPVGTPLIPGLALGGSPQLPAVMAVPRTGRVLGRATASDRAVAQPVSGAREHMLIVGPTGSGKSWLGARMFLDDVAAGRDSVLIDPKGTTAKLVIPRLPESAIGRTVIVDPTDAARPVPLPLLAAEAGGIPELAADTLVGLLRHRYRDLGPRSSDILSSSLYALARVGDATLLDLLPLWSDLRFRAHVAGLVRDDPVLASFFGWFEALEATERSAILAAPMNKIRPLLQRPIVRNVLAARRATFTLAQAMRERLVVIVTLPEGVLGSEATTLLGQVVLARLWAAVQARGGRSFYSVMVDEAPRFLDQPTDLGDALARSREYSVGLTLIAQALSQFPQSLREVALNSARTKVAFGTSATDAKRLAEEYGPGVEPDFFTGLGRYEAIGAVSLSGTVSPPFTFVTEPLEPPIPGRAKAVREASRERFGVPVEEIEAGLRRATGAGTDSTGPVGRRVK